MGIDSLVSLSDSMIMIDCSPLYIKDGKENLRVYFMVREKQPLILFHSFIFFSCSQASTNSSIEGSVVGIFSISMNFLFKC